MRAQRQAGTAVARESARACEQFMTLLSLVVVTACGNDGAAPLFPESYATSYAEVRNCRASADHDLHKIRIVADPIALPIYMARSGPFPDGSIIVKEEYDFTDGDCSGELVEWTVMQKVAGAWQWQRVDAGRSVMTENEKGCINCHASCGKPPDGHDGTCAVP